MAYGLKYYKELTQPNGKVVRLEILEKGYEGASKEIGPVCQALRLDIQGDTEIDAPIVKTSLSMTFVDAPDHADARTKKCGNWDEFYTSDATLWRVVLKARNAQETAFATIWGGYITPDSYTEVLQYRGSVTLVARDNIGHLSDFPFDAEGNADGMISLIELIREAWDKIESPMTLDDQAVANADWMLSDGVYAYDTYMNVSAFEDMNWYDALESALYAYGLVLRYTGNNNVSFYSLRNLPRMGAHEVEDISFIEPTFMSGAERELTPAVKRIEEAVEYKIESAIQPQVKHEDFTLNRDYYAYDYGSASGKLETGIVEAISNTDKTKGWANEADKTLFFDPNAYELSEYAKVQPYAETLKKSMYIAVNNVKNASLDNIDRFVTYGKTMRCQDFAYVFNLGMLIQWSGSGKISKVEGYSLSGMTYAVSMERLGITYYYAGKGRWQTSYTELNLEFAGSDANNSVEIPIGIGQYGSPDPANFVIYIKRISYTRQGYEASGRGLYVAIQSLEIASPQTSPIFAKNNVNTAYDNTNNVILSRDPKIAPALNTVSLPALIQNGIFIKRGEIYDSAKSWAWDGQTPQQMAVYNHLQLLCYHAKPNNILRGTIVNADVTDMQVIWMWHGAEHMLVSGTLDLISGYIENAVLREFARYEDMWGMLEPADMPEVEGKSWTNVEGGVAASNEGARMTSTTTVNIGGGGGSIVLDTFMSDTSQNGVQNRVIKAYVDDSCSDLDTRLQAKVDNIANNKADNTTVTALAERVSANEGAIDDNAGNIKKNFDVIAALGTNKADKATTLAGYGITDAYTKSDLESYKTWWDDVMGLVVKDGNNIRIKTNLIVEGDTSSSGSGQDTPASGTVTGIKVGPMSTDILTPNNAGIIDMVSVLSSIDVSDQLTAYAKTEDVNAALLTKQDTISDLATIRSGAALGATALQKITKTMVDSVLGSTTAGNANRFLMSTGSTSVWASISKTMVTDALGYTPLSTGGGTISGDTDALKIVRNTNGYSAITYYNTQNGATTLLGVMGFDSNGEPSAYRASDNVWHTLLHSGNYSDYALRLSGNQYYRFADSAGNTGFLTQDTSQNNTWYIVGKTNDYNVLLHSGNIGSQSVANAQRLLSPYSYPSNVITNTTTADSLFSESYSFSAMQEDHPLFGYATIWNFSAYLKFGATQLAAHYNALTPRLALRNYNQNVSGWSEWREFAFLDDNVASATKLANNSAFYAWGQMFFNNGVPQDANGYMLFNNGDIIHAKDANGSEQYVMGLTSVLSLGYGTSASGIDTYIEGNNVYLRYGTSHATGLTLNSSGNVTFGGRDLAGNVRKLVVDGSSEIAVLTQHPSNLAEIDRNKAFSVTYSPSNDYGLHIWLNDDGTTNMQSAYASSYYGAFNLSLQPLGGNVLIGTATDSGYKLDVNGDSRINGNLVVSGDTSSGSDIRFKDIIKNKTLKIEHIAKAPLFTFKWNDREDDTIHLGSSAQYWEKVTPWLVKGEDFKTLDYSTLGVAMGISLAKKAVNHEERIKELERKVKLLEEENKRLRYGN